VVSATDPYCRILGFLDRFNNMVTIVKNMETGYEGSYIGLPCMIQVSSVISVMARFSITSRYAVYE
jgi:hypothetical protein